MGGNRKRHKTERNVNKPGLWIIHPTRERPSIHWALLVCSADLEGVSSQSPPSVDGVWICHCLWVRVVGFSCIFLLRYAWLVSTFLKTICPGGPTPREAFNTHIYGSPNVCVILTMFTQGRCLYCKWRTSKNQWQGSNFETEFLQHAVLLAADTE